MSLTQTHPSLFNQRWPTFDNGVSLDGSERQWLIPAQKERLESQVVAPLPEHVNEIESCVDVGSAGATSSSYSEFVQDH